MRWNYDKISHCKIAIYWIHFVHLFIRLFAFTNWFNQESCKNWNDSHCNCVGYFILLFVIKLPYSIICNDNQTLLFFLSFSLFNPLEQKEKNCTENATTQFMFWGVHLWGTQTKSMRIGQSCRNARQTKMMIFRLE